MNWIYVLIFVVSCIVLVKAGSLVVKSLIRIAKYLHMTEFVVSFVLMAFATTIPELFVGVSSALHGNPHLSFGNVIGSNIINLTLALGIAALVGKGISCEGAIIQRRATYTLVIVLLPLLLMLDGSISRVDGVILILGLVLYIQRVFYHKERFTKIFASVLNGKQKDWQKYRLFLKDLLLFFLGLAFLLLSAEGIVRSASYIAQAMNLPLVIIGLLLVALGTNLPEITFGIKAIAMGHKDMVLGNLMGAVIANSTMVLGITVIIHPLEIVDFSPYLVSCIFVTIVLFFFALFSRTGQRISRKEGLFLILIYIAFVSLEIFLR